MKPELKDSRYCKRRFFWSVWLTYFDYELAMLILALPIWILSNFVAGIVELFPSHSIWFWLTFSSSTTNPIENQKNTVKCGMSGYIFLICLHHESASLCYLHIAFNVRKVLWQRISHFTENDELYCSYKRNNGEILNSVLDHLGSTPSDCLIAVMLAAVFYSSKY